MTPTTETEETTTITEISDEEYTDILETLLIEKLIPAAKALDPDGYQYKLGAFASKLKELIRESDYVFTVDEYLINAVEAVQEVGGTTEWDEQGNIRITIPGPAVVCSETVPNGSLHQILVTLTTGKVLCYDWYDLEHGDQPGWIELTLK